MARDRQVFDGTEIAIPLSGAERTLLQTDLAVDDENLDRKISSLSKSEPLILSADEIAVLCDCLNDASDRLKARRQHTHVRLLDKLEEHTAVERGDSMFNTPGEELRNGISTLVALMASTGISPAKLRCHVSLSPEDRLVLLNTLHEFDVIQDAIRSTPDGVTIRLTAIDLATTCFAIADRIDQADGPLGGRLEQIAIQLVTAFNEATSHVFAERSQAASRKRPKLRPLPKSAAPRLTLTAARRKVLSRIRPDLAARLKLNEPNARVIQVDRSELGGIADAAGAAMKAVHNGTDLRSLERIVHGVEIALADMVAVDTCPTTGSFHIRIELLDIEPPVWRRIEVSDCTLAQLHHYIQAAMGWNDAHLHCYRIDDVRFEPIGQLEMGHSTHDVEDTRHVTLSDMASEHGLPFQFEYEYDFGDGWSHAVAIEERNERPIHSPVCLGGARACPPEDVGGAWGYAEFLEAVADTSHPEHDYYMEWSGGFAPEDFDVSVVTTRLARQLQGHA